MKSDKVIAFTGGGTAGHIFPGLTVAEELYQSGYKRMVWIGSQSLKERNWVERAGITFYAVYSGKWRRYASLKNIGDIFRILLGFIQSWLILANLRPAFLFSKGGYVSVPPVAAAKLLKIPVFSHESDYDPGLATRINARFSRLVFVSFEATRKYFAKALRPRVIVSGNPVRGLFKHRNAELIFKKWNINPDKPVILVLGGSLGAVRLNRLITGALPKLTARYYIIHQMGPKNYKNRRHPNYLPLAFINNEMPHCIEAASLVISRAGANALFEYALCGKPAVLIPLESGSRGDQMRNAAVFSKAGAAYTLPEAELSGERLMQTIDAALDNQENYQKMKTAMLGLAKPKAAQTIVDKIKETLHADRG